MAESKASEESKQNNGQVFVVGSNGYTQFGFSGGTVNKLTEWSQNIAVKQINCGYWFTVITDTNDKYWCAGSNCYGSLGLGNNNREIKEFVRNEYFIKHSINIKSILTNSCGYATLFLSQTKRLYVCGYNAYNQLGMNHGTNLTQPTLINNVYNIKDAQSGWYHTILLDDGGNVYSTKCINIDYANYGQNGDGLYNFSKNNSNGFQRIPFFQNKTITQISVGMQHTLFMDSESNIWSSGNNDGGKLGLGHYNNTKNQNPQLITFFAKNAIRISKMRSGYQYNICLDDTGIVYAFGYNGNGRCGLPKDIKNTNIPIKLYTLNNHKIIEIKCGAAHSYCKSNDDKHWLFGYNGYNECSLSPTDKDAIYEPLYINETVGKLTNGKQIKDVYVGCQCTWILTEEPRADIQSLKVMDDKTMKDILSKNDESLQETKQLIDELSNTFLQSDSKNDEDDDEENVVPQEMSEFFNSVQDDLGCIAESQSQLQTTMELFDEILQHKPEDYDTNPDSKKLWDSIFENTQNTMNDIQMVQDMRDDYIGNLVEITDAMNEVETEDDITNLTKQMKAMTAAQEQYKQKIIKATENALKALKSFMKENVTKQEVDRINDDITKYQKLNFEADKEINSLNIKRTTEIKAINKNIEQETYSLNIIKSERDDIDEEMDEIRKLKIGREDSTKIIMYSYEWNQCSCTKYQRCSMIHVEYMNRWNVWRIEHDSQTLEMWESEMKDKCNNLEMEQHKTELKIKHYTEKKVQIEREYEEKIAEKIRKSKEYQNKFNQAMGDLDSTIKKTGVDAKDLNNFVNLTKNVIPKLMKDQESMNKLSTKCTSSYGIFIKGVKASKTKYEIRRYLKDNQQYEEYLDIYIKALSQSNMNYMHEIQCDTKQEFKNKIVSVLEKCFVYYPSNNCGIYGSFCMNKVEIESEFKTKIVSVLERRFIYYPSNNCGVYGSFCMNKVEIPTKVMRIFTNICCKNDHWRSWCKSSDAKSGGGIIRKKTKKFTSKLGCIVGKFQKKKKIKQIKRTDFILSSLDIKNGVIKCLDNDYNVLEFKVDINDKALIKQIMDTQDIGLKQKQNVYITINEVIYGNKTTEQTVIKAYIRNDGKKKQIEELENKLQSIEQEKDEEIALLKQKLSLQDKLQNEKSEEYTIESWLNDIVGLPEYIENFVEAGFDMEVLMDVTMDDLKEIKIQKLGHRKKIMKAIKNMTNSTK